MKFDIDFFKNGAWMRRKAWKPDKIVYLRPADQELLSFLVMKTDHGSAPYIPARCDLLEEDWTIDFDAMDAITTIRKQAIKRVRDSGIF